MKQRKFQFKAKVWKYKGHGGWYFVTLPKMLSKTIRRVHGLSEEGWGRLKVEASIGECKWNTAVWFDTKAASYLLPIKAIVRKSSDIASGKKISVNLEFKEEESGRNFIRKAR